MFNKIIDSAIYIEIQTIHIVFCGMYNDCYFCCVILFLLCDNYLKSIQSFQIVLGYAMNMNSPTIHIIYKGYDQGPPVGKVCT